MDNAELNRMDVEETPSAEMTRLALLKKIGAALAVASVGSISGVASAATRKTGGQFRQLKVAATVKPPLAAIEGKQYAAFFAHNGQVASALVLSTSDKNGIAISKQNLGASPALAKVENGVVQLSLGTAGASSSMRPGDMLSFNATTFANVAMPIVREG